MIDRVEIRVLSGKGGNGSVSGRREKFVPKGGPDGGDGGYGGNVYIRAVGGLSSLLHFRYKRRFPAGKGAHGAGKKRHGARGEDITVDVPVGTEVWLQAEGASRLADLSEEGDRIVIAHGGRGGRGNARFATSTNRFPVLAEEGDPGEELDLTLELKLLADVGIVGAPNAGKSSLLAAVTAAHPKVADYPFTTIEPSLGTVEIGYDSFVMVDIPGLIEGAHSGAGLGHDFLRHVQRTRVLVHLIDGEKEDSFAEYRRVRDELTLFDERLATRPEIVAVNKSDLGEVDARAEELRTRLGGRSVHIISALGRAGLGDLMNEVASTLAAARADMPVAMEREAVPVLRPRPVDETVEVRRTSGGYVVLLRAAERIAALVDPGDWQARTQLMEQLRKLGVVSAIEKAGARAGDTVTIGKLELEWE